MPDLVEYLAWSEDPKFLDLRKLVRATDKFLKSTNHNLKTYGFQKNKLQNANINVNGEDNEKWGLV